MRLNISIEIGSLGKRKYKGGIVKIKVMKKLNGNIQAYDLIKYIIDNKRF